MAAWLTRQIPERESPASRATPTLFLTFATYSRLSATFSEKVQTSTNDIKFRIAGSGNHAKVRVIVGLQPSDIKIDRTNVMSAMKNISLMETPVLARFLARQQRVLAGIEAAASDSWRVIRKRATDRDASLPAWSVSRINPLTAS